jgi:hypothetical protein
MDVIVNTRYPKLCFVEPGMLVSPCIEKTGEPSTDVFLVAYSGDEPLDLTKIRSSSNGLYQYEGELYLVDVRTGRLKDMPHLSTRAQIYRASEIVLVGGQINGDDE